MALLDVIPSDLSWYDRMPLSEQLAYANALHAIETSEYYLNKRDNLTEFAVHVDPLYKPAWFHKLLFSYLHKVHTREITRLIIEMPPQHGKTRGTSQIFPAWVLGQNPREKIIGVSFDDYLSSSNNSAVQLVMDSPEYKELFPNVKLGGANVRTLVGKPLRNTDVFDVVYKDKIAGRYSSTTVQGAVAGRGFTLGIVDDPIKDAKMADSPTYRQAQWDWWVSTFSKRKAPNAAIIIMTTRWHEDDLVGRILKLAKADPNADQWTVLSLPATYEPERHADGDIRTFDGEGLWLDYYGQKFYETERANTDTYYWNALYQQRPTSREGNIFKRAWYKTISPEQFANVKIKSVHAYWDLGGSDNPNADQTSGCLMALGGDNIFYIIEIYAGRWNPSDIETNLIRKCLQWGVQYKGLRVDVERGIGLGVIFVDGLIRKMNASGVRTSKDATTDSKYIRAGSFIAASENNQVRLVEGGWNEPFLLELSRLQLKETSNGIEFTGGHDDQLDSAVSCQNKLIKPRVTIGAK